MHDFEHLTDGLGEHIEHDKVDILLLQIFVGIIVYEYDLVLECS